MDFVETAPAYTEKRYGSQLSDVPKANDSEILDRSEIKPFKTVFLL